MEYRALPSRALILACLDTGDAFAWQEFVRRFQKLIATVAFRTSLRWGESSPQLIDELVQETYLKLCADDCHLLRSFQALRDDAIFGFIKVLTANLVHDHFRASRREKRGGSAMTESIDCELPGKRAAEATQPSGDVERKILMGQIEACLDAATTGPNAARDRRIFWLYYRVGLTASAIAGLPNVGLSTKGVESTILRLTQMVRRRLVTSRLENASRSGKGIRAAESL